MGPDSKSGQRYGTEEAKRSTSKSFACMNRAARVLHQRQSQFVLIGSYPVTVYHRAVLQYGNETQEPHSRREAEKRYSSIGCRVPLRCICIRNGADPLGCFGFSYLHRHFCCGFWPPACSAKTREVDRGFFLPGRQDCPASLAAHIHSRYCLLVHWGGLRACFHQLAALDWVDATRVILLQQGK